MTNGFLPPFRRRLAKPGISFFKFLHFPVLSLLFFFAFLPSCGKSSRKAEQSSIPVLSSPVNVATVSESGKVTVKWNEVAAANSYNIYFSNEAGVDPGKAAKIDGVKGKAYEHKGLKNGATYFYVVTAANAKGESPPSGEVAGMPRGVIPAQPAGVLASVTGEGAVNVKWEPVPAATSYHVYFADKPGMAAKTGTKETVLANSFTHTGLKNGTYYFYVVAALNDSGEGPVSPETGVLMKVSPPGQPANASVAVYPDKITVKWDAVAGAKSYNVYISRTEAFNRSKAKRVSVTSNSYDHTGLKKGDRYFYLVTAVNGSGEGRESNKVGAKI